MLLLDVLDFEIFSILPTCLTNVKLFFKRDANFDDFSKKNTSQYNLGVIFNSAFVDLILEINSIKIFMFS